MVAKLHGCMPSDTPTLTYSRDYGVSWEYHLVSTLLQFELCIVQFTSQYYFIIQEELKAYKNEYGNCNVPTVYEANPSFGTWVSTQRTQYNKGALSRERMQQLNDLEFEWLAL